MSGKAEKKILWVWWLRLVPLGILCAWLTSFWPAQWANWVSIIKGVWIGALALLAGVYYPIKYRRLKYKLDKNWLVIRCGVIYSRQKAIPLENIQFTTLASLPLPRLLGLRALFVHGAGGSLYFPGLPLAQAEALALCLQKGESHE